MNFTFNNPHHTTQVTWSRRLVANVVGLSLLLSGCSAFKNEPEKLKNNDLRNNVGQTERISDLDSLLKDAEPNEKSIRLSGGLTLGDTDNLAYTADELLTLLDSLLSEDKNNSARALVGLYPDIVTQLLIEANGSIYSWDRLEEIAKLFDQQWSGNGEDTWEDYIRTVSGKGKNASFIATREEFLNLLKNNQPERAQALKMREKFAGNRNVIIQFETLRLEGIAFLLLERHEQSSNHFSQAMQVLTDSHPYQASKIGLLLGESQRRSGSMDQWKQTWKTAIDLQSRWLSERGLSDPTFWKKAAFLRPASTPWPNQVVARLERSLLDENLQFSPDRSTDKEAVIWAIVGTQSLKRHEAQNAILSFKKCEAIVSNRKLKEELQMQQALAMVDSGQQGPASAILLRLGSSNSLVSDRAKAILATMKLQNGSLAQGMNLLQSAIGSSNQWPVTERLRAQADYGLAYLMRGKEEQGIRLLNQIHSEFLKHNNFEHAAQCLSNIATYYQQTDQTSKYRDAVDRLDSLESL
ncbi:MAG: hypothetical protein P8J27_17725 [Mariniblastus sp.]|nr:hypothetical protein [Mariniblastus sp.]